MGLSMPLGAAARILVDAWQAGAHDGSMHGVKKLSGFPLLASLAIVSALTAVVGCGSFSDPGACDDAEVIIAEPNLSAIQKAIRFLWNTQVREDEFTPGRMDYAGNWRQCFSRPDTGERVRDISPFMPAFAHHALSLVNEQTQDVLGLTQRDIDDARAMRQRAIAFMMRFAGDADGPEAGTFGFWPPFMFQWFPGVRVQEAIFTAAIDGPEFAGTRTPANFPAFPRLFAVHPDADVTATTYAALLDHAVLDGGAVVTEDHSRLFADWLDDGVRPQRHEQPWIPRPSGAFLTWLQYGASGATRPPNDVDLPVNANVLYALGRFNRLDAPGAAEAIAWINDAVTVHNVHLTAPDVLSLYYPDNLSLHYFVTRAWREGGVTDLSPAVEALVDDLLNTAQVDGAGRVFWDRGAPVLNTAFAALALINADAGDDLIAPAIEFLIAHQNADTGGWPAELFFIGELEEGVRAEWSSAAFTTAMVLEALVRAGIGHEA